MDLSKYAALFLAESREHLNACNGSLLEWERAPSSVEPVDRLFRAIHTIKGMAATMGYSSVARLAHAGETLLDSLRKGRVAADPAIFQLLYRAVDTLGASVESAGAGTEQEPDSALINELEQAAVGSPNSGATTAPAGDRCAAFTPDQRGDPTRRGDEGCEGGTRSAPCGNTRHCVWGAAAHCAARTR